MAWLTVPLAFLVDLAVGDPSYLPHPVKGIGKAITRLEIFLRGLARSNRGERMAGILLAISIPAMAWAGTWVLCYLAGLIHGVVGVLVSAWFISTTIATRGLVQVGDSVYSNLAQENWARARQVVDGIVGRDTGGMDEAEMVRATVETMAENIVDGVVAPLFFAFLGGAPLAMAYRAINTLDSMVGYRNERYLYFGWASARLDDLANYLPARITGVFIVLAAALLGYHPVNSLRVIISDSRKHPSPNSGIPEAGVAGALGVQLGGTNYYGGIPSFRPRLGMADSELNRQTIKKVARFVYVAGIMAVLSGACISRFLVG
ncbi:MAG: adenosylcobinamide-phosphate synthase CbiB [Syntrophomonadaceae bacterium]